MRQVLVCWVTGPLLTVFLNDGFYEQDLVLDFLVLLFHVILTAFVSVISLKNVTKVFYLILGEF